MPRSRPVDQLGMDEKKVDDEEIEAALEEREKKKDSLGAVKKIYDGAHEAALAAIVTFDTKPSSRLRISLADEG